MDMGKVAEIYARVGIDTTGLAADFRTLRNILRKGMRAAMVGLGAGLSIAGITTKLAADAEEAANLFYIVFKHASDGVVAELDKFAEAAGRGRWEMKNYAAGFGALLNPMGFTTDEVAKLSTQLAILSSDMASFFNTTDDDAAFALTSALTGQIRPMRRYGVNIAKAAVGQEALRMGIVKNVKEMGAQERVLATLNIIMRETEQLQGDAIRTQASLTNQWRRFYGALKDIGVEIGNVFRPMATQLFTLLGKFLQPLSKNQALFAMWANTLNEELKKIIKAFSEAAVATVQAFTGGAGGMPSMVDAIRAVSSGIQWLANSVKDLMTSSWAPFITGVIRSIPRIVAFTLAAGTLESAFVAVAAALKPLLGLLIGGGLAGAINPITLAALAVTGFAMACIDAKVKGQTWMDSIAEWTAIMFGFENSVTAANAAIKANEAASERARQASRIAKGASEKFEEGTINSKAMLAEIEQLKQLRQAQRDAAANYQSQYEAAQKKNREYRGKRKEWSQGWGSSSTASLYYGFLAHGEEQKMTAMNEAVATAAKTIRSIDARIAELDGMLQSIGMDEQAQADIKAVEDARRKAVQEGAKALVGWGKDIGEATKMIGRDVLLIGLNEMDKVTREKLQAQNKENVDAAVKALGLTPEQIKAMQAETAETRQKELARQIVAEGLNIDPALLGEKQKKEKKTRTAEFIGLADFSRQLQSAIGGDPELQTAKKTEENTKNTADKVGEVKDAIVEFTTDMVDAIKNWGARAT